jgi:hypothetical protein
LVRDYEVKIEHSEAMIYLSMSKRMLARIAGWIPSGRRFGLFVHDLTFGFTPDVNGVSSSFGAGFPHEPAERFVPV